MDKSWYALYVKSRAEKKVAADLSANSIEYYLPLQKVLKQWSDRKKWVEEPLFRSYVFVRIISDDYYKVLQLARTENDLESLVLYFLKGVEVTAKQTITLITNIRELMQDYKNKIRTELPKIYSQDLLNNLFKNPYTKIEFLEKDLVITRQTASIYLDKITNLGLLEKVKIGKTNYYINSELITVLENV